LGTDYLFLIYRLFLKNGEQTPKEHPALLQVEKKNLEINVKWKMKKIKDKNEKNTHVLLLY